ncbi:DUF3068 domain-containing protein [Corynebacterium sp. H127]|uniref:DUF3068 domain-containing protein n=1 Tax=Corynebacterium sp. H127 TaxID=3133418 RepID=UPI0030B14FC6
MTPKAKATTAFVLTFILLALRMVGPALATSQVRLLQVGASMQTTTESAEATLFNAAAWEAGTPVDKSPECEHAPALVCFIERPLVTASRTITSQPGETRKDIKFHVSEDITADSNNVLFTSQDEARFVRHSSFPVDEPIASLRTSSPIQGLSHETHDQVRTGLQYVFPFATEFRSYDYFDKFSATTSPIDFHDREKLRGETVYRFHQAIEPTQLDGSPITGLARQFYTEQELEAEGISGSSVVALNRYYSITRTLWVEPKTGTIVDSVEIPHVFLAGDTAEAEQTTPKSPRTLYTATLRWNQSSQGDAWTRAKSGLRVLKSVQVGVVLATTGAAVFGALGLFYLRRRV